MLAEGACTIREIGPKNNEGLVGQDTMAACIERLGVMKLCQRASLVRDWRRPTEDPHKQI